MGECQEDRLDPPNRRVRDPHAWRWERRGTARVSRRSRLGGPGAIQMTEEELLGRQRLREAASNDPGVSFVEGRDHDSGSILDRTEGLECRGPDCEPGIPVADQDVLAESRRAVPHSIAEVRRPLSSAVVPF